MSKPINVRPVDGARVRIPEAGYRVMGPEGATVRGNSYWTRRLLAGDVELVAKAAAGRRRKKPADDES